MERRNQRKLNYTNVRTKLFVMESKSKKIIPCQESYWDENKPHYYWLKTGKKENSEKYNKDLLFKSIPFLFRFKVVKELQLFFVVCNILSLCCSNASHWSCYWRTFWIVTAKLQTVGTLLSGFPCLGQFPQYLCLFFASNSTT